MGSIGIHPPALGKIETVAVLQVATVIYYNCTASPLAEHASFGKLAFFECRGFFATERSEAAFAMLNVALAHEKLKLGERRDSGRRDYESYEQSDLPKAVIRDLEAYGYHLATRPLADETATHN